jgi:hypothetical protein
MVPWPFHLLQKLLQLSTDFCRPIACSIQMPMSCMWSWVGGILARSHSVSMRPQSSKTISPSAQEYKWVPVVTGEAGCDGLASHPVGVMLLVTYYANIYSPAVMGHEAKSPSSWLCFPEIHNFPWIQSPSVLHHSALPIFSRPIVVAILLPW